jgi:hypothetical protein
MTTGTIRRLAAGAMLVALMAGCGGAASPSASTGSAAPSVAAPSVAASTEASTAPSEAAPSEAAPSTAPSIALPSLPSEAKDLEAVLPSSLCGTTATKVSLSGASFAANADPDFKAVLSALGKSPSDVAFAIAIAGDSGCGAGIFRVQGVDSGALQAAFNAQVQKSGDTFTDKNVGGKDVKIQATSGVSNYLYFKGDALIFASAKTEADAASILQQLP